MSEARTHSTTPLIEKARRDGRVAVCFLCLRSLSAFVLGEGLMAALCGVALLLPGFRHSALSFAGWISAIMRDLPFFDSGLRPPFPVGGK